MVELEGSHALRKVLLSLLTLAAPLAELEYAAAPLKELSAKFLNGAIVRWPVNLPVGEEVFQVVAGF